MPRDSRRAVSAQRTPRQNHLLAALPFANYERLLPDLKPVSLPLGEIIHRSGEREKHLYFLTSGIVSRLYVTENGASAECSVTGNEGVIGVACFLGGESTPSQAVVVSPGYAYQLAADRLKIELEHNRLLALFLLRYTQAMITQIAQIAVCNRHHTLEQRLCLWILSCLDRLPSNELAMTQELIAHMLGVRREGVTAAAGKLQTAGIIHYSRGHIIVLDRPKLKGLACECYAVVKREYDRLIPAS